MTYKELFCPRCKKLKPSSGNCWCKLYSLRIPDYHGDDWESVWASRAEEAVVSFCERVDPNADYLIISNNGSPVQIKIDGEPVEIFVEAETVPQYHVRFDDLSKINDK